MAEVETVDLGKRIAQQRLKATALLEKESLHLPARPSFRLPRLPLNLTDKDDEGVMELLVKMTRYQDHLAGQLIEAEIDESSASTLLELAKAKHLAGQWTGASSDRVAVQKAQALMDREVQEANGAYEQARAKRKLYSVLVESTARDAAVVSRELTRRTSGSKYS